MGLIKTMLVAAWLLLVASAVSPAADYYVSANGNDTNAGGKDAPFATVGRARDAVRGKIAQGMNGDVVVEIAPGRYFQNDTLTFDDRDGGREGHSVTYRGSGERGAAEVYGGVPVTGWKRWKGQIWCAPVPKNARFFNLIVDGKPATMAQIPKAGSGYGGGAVLLNNGAIAVPKEWRGYDFSDAQVFGFIGGNWFSEMRGVTSFDPASGRLNFDGGSGNFNGLNSRFFVRGVLEFLTEPGEWCLKSKEGYVYYWPVRGTPDQSVIVRPVSERLAAVKGRSASTPVRNLAFENLSFIGSDFANRWYIFPGGKDNSIPDPLQTGMIYGENVEGLTVRFCRLLAAGHSAVFLNKYAQHCTVYGNLIQGAGFVGVYMNGWTMGEGPFKSAAESYVNKGHRIENNFIYDCGKFIGAGCGIQFYQSGDNLIDHNEIAQMPRYGISYKGDGYGAISRVMYGQPVTFANHFDFVHTRNNKIIGNEIHSVCRNSFDYGGIESWGPSRDNLWEGNDVHDMDPALDWDGWAHVLFADDASDYLTIRGNIIHHCYGGGSTGAMMLKSIEETIENNLVVDCRIGRLFTFEPYVQPCWNVTVRGNIFAADSTGSRYGAMNAYSIHGKPFMDVVVPAGASGFREIDHNFITPADPAKPNPFAQNKMDLHSVFESNLVTCAAPEWNATRFDYRIRELPGMEFQTSTFADMGLRDDFPFDKAQATRRRATSKIQAEEYQRMSKLRTIGGVGIGYIADGTWAKYENIDFGGDDIRHAEFQLQVAPAPVQAQKTFIRRYGDTVVEATPFAGDTIMQWEVSKPYMQAGKTGTELFDIPFPPEKDINNGQWQPVLGPTTSKSGVTSPPGVVDLDVVNGEGNANACAYMRSSIYAPTGRTHATMTVTCASGAKVWLNGELVIAKNGPGAATNILGVIRQGWNTVLIKVNQDNAAWTAKTTGLGNFWAKFTPGAASCGNVVYLPGLPTNERATTADHRALIEMHLDAPNGPVIGRLESNQTTCLVSDVGGIHNLFLVFPGHSVQLVDWFKFE